MSKQGNNAETDPENIVVSCKADGICGEGENHLYCPEDCDVEKSDSVCEAVVDGKCDPDCEKGYDPDCKVNEKKIDVENKGLEEKEEASNDNTIVYIVGGIIAIVLIYSLIKMRRK